MKDGEDMLRFFTPPRRPANETERQAAVDRLNVVDAARDPRLAAIVARAAAIFAAPTAMISIVDGRRQRWIVRHSTDDEGTSRTISFCGHAILEPQEVLAVPDALADERFAGNPLVQGEAGIRLYVGAPLVQNDSALGSLCVIDRQPHDVTAAQTEELRDLAREAVSILERLGR